MRDRPRSLTGAGSAGLLKVQLPERGERSAGRRGGLRNLLGGRRCRPRRFPRRLLSLMRRGKGASRRSTAALFGSGPRFRRACEARRRQPAPGSRSLCRQAEPRCRPSARVRTPPAGAAPCPAIVCVSRRRPSSGQGGGTIFTSAGGRQLGWEDILDFFLVSSNACRVDFLYIH